MRSEASRASAAGASLTQRQHFQRLALLLPEDLEPPRAARATLRAIQRRAFRAVVRGEEALLEPMGSARDQPGAEEEAVA